MARSDYSGRAMRRWAGLTSPVSPPVGSPIRMTIDIRARCAHTDGMTYTPTTSTTTNVHFHGEASDVEGRIETPSDQEPYAVLQFGPVTFFVRDADVLSHLATIATSLSVQLRSVQS